MKNSKGETLQQPYYDLALMRREQYRFLIYEKHLASAFSWVDTLEGGKFWANVSGGLTPDIPASSLAELESWRKSREENKQSEFWGKAAMVADELRPEPDYKAMYEELEVKYKDLQWTFSELREQKIELEKRAENTTTPSRNWIAECAMRVYASNMFSNAKDAWDWAEKWAAEGKKRGYIV